MKKKWLTVALALALTVSTLAGCGGSSEKADTTEATETEGEKVEGGTFTYPMPTDLGNLDRHLHGYKEGHIMLNPIWDKLYQTDGEDVRYYLAESREVSDDGMTITVKLKGNLKWHDGEKITTDDFDYCNKCFFRLWIYQCGLS